MTIRDRYDVVIAGGGLAGLCLALQIRQTRPSASVLVAERLEHPAREAAHKVGESSVEVGSHYFEEILGLADLLQNELRKFGLRFFMSHEDNRDIATRLECGPSRFLHVPSYQIDRGRFENALARKLIANGGEFLDGCEVAEVALSPNGADHSISLGARSSSVTVSSRWLVDATGRSSLLKKQLGLARSNRHNANAAWFRIDHPIDPDRWSDDPSWRARNKHPRRLSTNHLMGEGYWVWLIPLAGGQTSVGIVSDERLHPFREIRTFDAALGWLDRHEPQCADVVRSLAARRMDFRALKNYSHDVEQVFSRDRWCVIGDAGFFADPLYSPGSDFIGIANGFCCDLISRDLDGSNIDDLVRIYDQSFRSLARTFMLAFRRQYSLMGDGRVMSAKIVWDFVMYWGGVALLFFRNKLTDPKFMETVLPILRGFAQVNVETQSIFRKWADVSRGESAPSVFVDYAEIGFLAEMNRNLLRRCDDDGLRDQLTVNLDLARALKLEILAASGDGSRPPTSHLGKVFESMGVERNR